MGFYKILVMGFGFFIPQIALAVGKKKKMVSQHEILQ
jgi:hypothetical protein